MRQLETQHQRLEAEFQPRSYGMTEREAEQMLRDIDTYRHSKHVVGDGSVVRRRKLGQPRPTWWPK